MQIYTEADIRRFYSYVNIKGPDECWEWIGTSSMGYGQFHFRREESTQLLIPAHRFAFWFTTGIWPGDLQVCHNCDNRLCVNARHLWLGTAKDNMQDAVRKGRMAYGERNGSAKLTEDEVREIRAKFSAGVSRKQLSVEYNVNHTSIWRIVHYKNWKHV